MCLWFSKVGRIAGTSRHPQPRPSLHQVWHIRASMFNQDQPRDSKNVPTVLQSQTQDMPSCCFNHGGAGEQVLGESSQNFIDFTVHFIWQRKSPFLQNLLWIYGSLRTADILPVVTSLPPKNKFLQRSNNQKYVCGSQARYMEKCVVCFFSAADQVTLLE